MVDTQSQPGYANFSVYDISSGVTWSTAARLNGLNSSGSAEAIIERPQYVGGGYPQLSDFGTLNFQYVAAAQDGLAYPLDTYPTNWYNMYTNSNATGNLLAQSGGLGDGFSDYWHHCS